MNYIIKTKTPIWTGGVESISDTIHVTGILGSLRWWYEVILRGLGVFACDPTETDAHRTWHSCPVDDNKRWCNACDIFGTTGRQRKFKLNINRGINVYSQKDKDDLINIKPTQCNPVRSHGWFLGAGRIDENQKGLALMVKPLAVPASTIDTMLKVLLCLLSKWGGIGARQQHGYGIFDMRDGMNQSIQITEGDLNTFLNAARDRVNDRRNDTISAIMPQLNNVFFAKIKLTGLAAGSGWEDNIDGRPANGKPLQNFNEWHKNHPSRIIAAALKNQLRYVAFQGDTDKQRKLFGSIGKDKSGAKVNVSHVYDANGNKEVRVWGEIQDTILRNEFYTALNNTTYWQAATGCNTVKAQIIEWREEKGSAAKCKKQSVACTNPCTDTASFIKCLIS